MSQFLDKLTFWEQMLLKDWLKSTLSLEQQEDLFRRDSCPLSELICLLFNKRDSSDLANPAKQAWLMTTANEVAEEMCKQPYLAFALVERMLKKYQKAVEAIMGNVLEAEGELVGAEGRVYTKYWVNPQKFFLWVKEKQVMETSHISNILKSFVLPKTRGRRPDQRDEQMLEMLVDLSCRFENKGCVTAGKLFENNEIQTAFTCQYKGLSEKQLAGKKDYLIKKLRNCSDFAGKRRVNLGRK